jgi:hypothetical protein
MSISERKEPCMHDLSSSIMRENSLKKRNRPGNLFCSLGKESTII